MLCPNGLLITIRRSNIVTVDGNTKVMFRPNFTLEDVVQKDLGFFNITEHTLNRAQWIKGFM